VDFVVAGATGPVTRLDVRTIVKSSVGSTGEIVSIQDVTTGTWTQLSSATIGTSEATRTSSVASPARYIDTGGNIRLRIDTNRMLSTYTLSIEQVQVTITY
jgi:hypothetical protein